MIFLIEKPASGESIKVVVYDSLEDLAQRVEWQDILEQSLRILDEEGNIYVWDDTKTNEWGIVYGYSLITNGTDTPLASKCKEKLNQLGHPGDFKIEVIV